MFVCCDCKVTKCLSKIIYCNYCPNMTCNMCYKSISENGMHYIGCELCMMKQDTILKYKLDTSEYEIVKLCEQIEHENEQDLLSLMGGLQNFPEGVCMDTSSFELPPEDDVKDDEFEKVLNFWCDSPWWWNFKNE